MAIFVVALLCWFGGGAIVESVLRDAMVYNAPSQILHRYVMLHISPGPNVHR